MVQAYSKIWPQIFDFYLEVVFLVGGRTHLFWHTQYRLALLFLIAGYWLMQSKLSHKVHNIAWVGKYLNHQGWLSTIKEHSISYIQHLLQRKLSFLIALKDQQLAYQLLKTTCLKLLELSPIIIIVIIKTQQYQNYEEYSTPEPEKRDEKCAIFVTNNISASLAIEY